MKRAPIILHFLCVLLASSAGCARTHREPGESAQRATLQGKDGTYINQIDGADVASARYATEAGGNRVAVLAGRRRVRAYTLSGGERAAGLWTFNFDFEAGHAYELSPRSEKAVSLRVRDVTTGKVVDVD